MIARAPGKVVVSGAYAVLDGAPAVVVAVDRYVTADAERPATFVTPEVRAALGAGPTPWFDASPLRDGAEKLGLGSSAAILVASLAARELALRGPLPDPELVRLVFDRALRAHREAQGGGSGIDVAASCYGGTVLAQRDGESLTVTPRALPTGVTLEVWAAGQPASTPALLARVRELAARSPDTHRALLQAQGAAARAGASALESNDGRGFVAALAEQCACLARLGEASGAPIVTAAVHALAVSAEREGAAVIPSGAGGGDIALYAGLAPPSPGLRALATAHGHRSLALTLEARGVHAVGPG